MQYIQKATSPEQGEGGPGRGVRLLGTSFAQNRVFYLMVNPSPVYHITLYDIEDSQKSERALQKLFGANR